MGPSWTVATKRWPSHVKPTRVVVSCIQFYIMWSCFRYIIIIMTQKKIRRKTWKAGICDIFGFRPRIKNELVHHLNAIILDSPTGSCCCGSHFGAGQNPLVQCDVWPIRLFGRSERSGAMVAMAIHIPYQIGNQLELRIQFPIHMTAKKTKMGSLWTLEIDEIDRWLWCAWKWWQLVWRTFHSATHVMPLKMRNCHLYLYNGTHDDKTMGYGGVPYFQTNWQTHRFGCAWYNIVYWVSPYNYITYVHCHLTTKNLEGF